jgi:hypothetical protein
VRFWVVVALGIIPVLVDFYGSWLLDSAFFWHIWVAELKKGKMA